MSAPPATLAPPRPAVRPAVAAPARTAADRWLIASLGALLAALAGALVWTVARGMIFGFGDAPSHVVLPRRVFDSAEPSIAQLGTHWAPLYHLLQLPFVWIDPVFRSGASGVAVSVVASLVTGFFLYRLVLLVGAGRPAAVASALLLAVSPSFLYVGVVPMLPALIMATTTANAFFLTRWALHRRGQDVLLAGLTLTLAMLSHFDTWSLLPIELLVVAVLAHRSSRSREHREATVILWLLSAGWGITVFLIANLAIYGKLTAFLGNSSANNPLAGTPGHEIAAPLGWTGLSLYPRAAFMNAGIALVAVAAAGGLAYLLRNRRSPRLWVPLVMLYPIVTFSVAAATQGSWILSASKVGDWVNLRYGATILPALAFLAAAGLRRVAPLVAAVASVAVVGAIMVSSGSVATWANARNNERDWAAVKPAASWLHQRGAGDRILIPVADRYVDAMELFSDLPTQSFVDVNAYKEWNKVLDNPASLHERGIRWMIFFVNDPVHRSQAQIHLTPEAADSTPEHAALFSRLAGATGAKLCYTRGAPNAATVRIWSAYGGCKGAATEDVVPR